MDRLVAGRFRLDRRIGAGSFGAVYAAVDANSSEQVAVKVEPSSSKQPQLLFEAKVCKSLAGREGFPQLRHVGLEARSNVLVMDLLGPSLGDLAARQGGSFSLKTILMLADQLVERLEVLHSQGYVHRDIKPENILLGRGEHAGCVHLIDFGLCKRFKDPKTEKHIEYRNGKKLTGTLLFASLNACRGAELSRRDDLEAVGYLLMYLLRGSLPWQHLPAAFTKRVAHEALLQAKGSLSVPEMCADLAEGQGPLSEYLSYCKGLGFKECPNYMYLRSIFIDALVHEGMEHDLVFDWTTSRDITARTLSIGSQSSSP